MVRGTEIHLLLSKLSETDTLDEQGAELSFVRGKLLVHNDPAPIPTSSSEVRALLLNGQQADRLLHPDVADWIAEKKLYSTQRHEALLPTKEEDYILFRGKMRERGVTAHERVIYRKGQSREGFHDFLHRIYLQRAGPWCYEKVARIATEVSREILIGRSDAAE